MKNREGLKKVFIIIFVLVIVNILVIYFLHKKTYQQYNINLNNKVGSIISLIKDKYPSVTDDEVIEILNSDTKSDILRLYGYDKNTSIIKDNNYNKYVIFLFSFLSLDILIIVLIIYLYDRKKSRQIDDILFLLEQINNKNYALNIDELSEDKISILKNEIYKVAIMLKESAINSNNDKLELKKSLEDISHQLKTPLTSIMIMLDNLIDNPDMDNNLRNEFIRDIKRDVNSINFLVQSILKLSKFDANTVKYINEEVFLKDILDKAIKNVSTILDLKNININVLGNDDIKIKCDFMWQIEALTNIIKNCIEHSSSNNSIDIKFNQNSIYTKICIKDYGEGISSADLPHIFERFYQGKNAKSDSVGIGLALAKTIIEKNNGSIKVKTSCDGSEFIIKYFNF